MAKILSQAGIETSNLVEAWHVTQSIDAFTGVEAYDITLSGSLTVTGSTNIDGDTTITGSFIVTDEAYDFISSTYYLSEKINTNTYQLSVPNTVDANTFPTLDWFSGSLKDQSTFNRNSVNWLSRTLHNTSGVSILNWSSGINITGSTRISGSLSVTGSVGVKNLTNAVNSNLVLYNSTTGQVSYYDTGSIILTTAYSTAENFQNGIPVPVTHSLNSSALVISVTDTNLLPPFFPRTALVHGTDYTYQITSFNTIEITPTADFGNCVITVIGSRV